MDLNKVFLDIIEKKYKELGFDQVKKGMFIKARHFEANAVGQVGEIFIKKVVKLFTNIINETNIHDEYDVLTENNIKIEVKTAKKGTKNNTFQFNSINPIYNYNFIFCIGITDDEILYRIIKQDEIKYIHYERAYRVISGDINKKLSPMNPGNQVSYKITLTFKQLKSIENLLEEIKPLL